MTASSIGQSVSWRRALATFLQSWPLVASLMCFSFASRWALGSDPGSGIFLEFDRLIDSRAVWAAVFTVAGVMTLASYWWPLPYRAVWAWIGFVGWCYVASYIGLLSTDLLAFRVSAAVAGAALAIALGEMFELSERARDLGRDGDR